MFLPSDFRMQRRDSPSLQQSTSTTVKSTPAVSSITANVPTPIMVGAAVGVCVVAVLGFVVYHRNRHNKRVRLLNEPNSARTKLDHPQHNSLHADTIAEMTAVGINLPLHPSPALLGTTSKVSSKPKIITMKSPFSSLSAADTLPAATDAGTPTVLRAVVIPRRTMSISMENGATLTRKRSLAPATGFTTSTRSPNSTLPRPMAASPAAPGMPLPLKRAGSPASSEASSMSSIESDDMEPETRFTVARPWMPQRHDELELFPGDQVIVYQIFEEGDGDSADAVRVLDGWCDGRVEGQEETGAFPFACLQACEFEVSGRDSLPEGVDSVTRGDSQQSLHEVRDADVAEEEEERPSVFSGQTGFSSLNRKRDSGQSARSGASGESTGSGMTVRSKDLAKNRFSAILKNIDNFIEEDLIAEQKPGSRPPHQ
ncbi:hypothetical protein BC830DRAFT_1182281 [Chytriomyces sp. MP71]|nr:hypothetical protein BC830DRAFT_1182281 [Chytriomyces sp. MP71]